MRKTALLIAGLFLTVGLGMHCYLLDGLDGSFWSGGFKDDKVYSLRYSDAGSRRISRGMTRPPLDEFQVPTGYAGMKRDTTGWRWSRPAHDGSYRVRVVHLEGDRVGRKVASFYID